MVSAGPALNPASVRLSAALSYRMHRVPWVPIAIIVLTVAVAILAPALVSKSPYSPSLPNRLMPPMWLPGGNPDYPLGTDSLGRDLLTRLVFGARVSLTLGLLALVAGGGVGLLIGLVSGYLGGTFDAVISRVIDGALAFPSVLIAMMFAVALGPSYETAVLAISLVLWARFARIIRGQVLSIRGLDYVLQARISGCSTGRVIAVHIFPNVLNTVTVLATLEVGWIILVEATLSFLGAGVPPPIPSWGQMVAEGRSFIGSAWWIALFPGTAIALVVLALNLFGDWLRDALDPTLRQL